MFKSISPKRKKFTPSFPLRSKHFKKQYNYKRSSILDAIEHFKQQLSKIDHKSRKSPCLSKEPEKSNKSMNLIELSLSFNDNTPSLSQHNIVTTLPTKTSLPPLRAHKRKDFKEIDDLVCMSKRPAYINQESKKKTIINSKSHKIKQIIPANTKIIGQKTGRKKIIISNNYLFDTSSESSSSIVMDPTLLD